MPDGAAFQATSDMLIHGIRKQEEMFLEKETQELLRYLSVYEWDILDIPALPVECVTEKEVAAFIDERIKKGYTKILAERIADFLEGKWKVRWMILDQISRERIIKEVSEGKFKSFIDISHG